MAMHSGEIYQAQAARFTGGLFCWFYPAGTVFAANLPGAVRQRDVMVNLFFETISSDDTLDKKNDDRHS